MSAGISLRMILLKMVSCAMGNSFIGKEKFNTKLSELPNRPPQRQSVTQADIWHSRCPNRFSYCEEYR